MSWKDYMRLYIQREVHVDWKPPWFFLYIEQKLFPMLRLHSSASNAGNHKNLKRLVKRASTPSESSDGLA